MTNMKHTPGPWIVIEGGPLEGDTVITTQARLAGDIIPIVDMDTDYEGEIGIEQEANAKLIAAAPELLEACSTMAEWFKREHEGFPNAAQVRTTPAGEAAWRKWWEENLRLCDLAKTQANAAISKATE
jgi:hypothetical protein